MASILEGQPTELEVGLVGVDHEGVGAFSREYAGVAVIAEVEYAVDRHQCLGRSQRIGTENPDAIVNVRLTAAEKAKLREDAELASLSVSEFVRRWSLGRPVLAKVDAAVIRELRRLERLVSLSTSIVKSSRSWEERHHRFVVAGMRYEKTGSGAAIFIGEVGVKASSADRGASLA